MSGNKSASNHSLIFGNNGHTRHDRPSHRQVSPRTGSTLGASPTSGTISLLDTVPGLSQKLDADSWISQTDRDHNEVSLRSRGVFNSNSRNDPINVYSQRPLTPVNGGDLGMRFNSSNQKEDSDSDKDRIRPCEGVSCYAPDSCSYDGDYCHPILDVSSCSLQTPFVDILITREKFTVRGINLIVNRHRA